MSEEVAVTKRMGGRVVKGEWLVLTESEKLPEGGYKHKCGHEVLGAVVTFSNRDGIFPLSGDGSVRSETVPYCPNCEREPRRGEFGPGVGNKLGFLVWG